MATIPERVYTLEKTTKIHFDNINKCTEKIERSVEEIKSSLAPIPEFLRKVNEHHEYIKNHKTDIENNTTHRKLLERAGCPGTKVLPVDLENLERQRVLSRRWNVTTLISLLVALIGIAAIYFTK